MIFSLAVLFTGFVYAISVHCKDNFTTCTEGGCDANPGWWADNCYIYGCTAAPSGFKCSSPGGGGKEPPIYPEL